MSLAADMPQRDIASLLVNILLRVLMNLFHHHSGDVGVTGHRRLRHQESAMLERVE
jgi:hypothetical protein